MESEADIAGIGLLPLGPLSDPLADHLAQRVSRSVGVPCRVLPGDGGLVLPRLATRQQVDADALLRLLEQRDQPDGSVLVGITTADIGNPVFTFFFGRARQGGPAALISLARLDPAFYGLPDDEGVLLERATVEVLHELGHIAGLPHCDDAECLMRFAGHVEALDVRGKGFCGDCRSQLPDGLSGGGRPLAPEAWAIAKFTPAAAGPVAPRPR
jgi:archaemetzincin